MSNTTPRALTPTPKAPAKKTSTVLFVLLHRVNLDGKILEKGRTLTGDEIEKLRGAKLGSYIGEKPA